MNSEYLLIVKKIRDMIMKTLLMVLISYTAFAQVLYTVPTKSVNNVTYSLVNDTTEAYLIDRSNPLYKDGDEAIENWLVINPPSGFLARQIQGTTQRVLSDIEAGELLGTSILFPYKRPITGQWEVNQRVEIGDVRTYKGKTYTCRVKHITLEHYNPENTLVYLWTIEPIGFEWTIGVSYSVNDSVTYQSKSYKCIQAHVSQSDWMPPAVPSLWEEYQAPVSGCPDFVQPTAQTYYNIGDCVKFNGKCYESKINVNVYSPIQYPAGWQEIVCP